MSKSIVKEIYTFEKYYYGPFSRLLEEIIKNPLYCQNCYSVEGDKYSLTSNGQKKYSELIRKYDGNDKFAGVILRLKLIRELYDKLSFYELLFLVYSTYPDFTIYSKISDSILKNEEKRNRILSSLIQKKVITEKRYVELKKSD